MCYPYLSLLWGGALLGNSLSSPASALSSSKSARTKINATIDSVISITAPPSGNLTESGSGDAPITPTPNGTTATYSEDVVVSTNNLTGYKLQMSMAPGADNNKLNNILDPNISISSITSATPLSSLPANTWGYNVPSLSSHGTNYQSLPDPTASAPEQKQHTIRPDGHMGTETTTVNFATKVDTSQPAGSYNNTVLYTATASDPPQATAKAILGENKNLNFVYDANEYTEGQTYTDNLGETTISRVYDVPYNTQVIEECYEGECYVTDIENAPGWIGEEYGDPTVDDPWGREDITSANFTPNFSNYTDFTSTAGWFYSDAYLITITNASNLNTANVTDMSWMFYYTGAWFYSEDPVTFSLNLSNWDTGNVINMSSMFFGAGNNATTFSLDLSGWNTSNVTNMSYMFYFAGYSAQTWSIGDLSGWNTSQVTNMSDMFAWAGGQDTNFDISYISNWNTSNVTNMSGMFSSAGQNATTWSIGDLSGWSTSNVTNMSYMFSNAGESATTWSIGDLSGWSTSNVTNMSYMFSDAGYNATTFSLNLSNWDTSNVTAMSDMLSNAGHNATTFSLDLSGWNTSNVTNMSYMFRSAGYSAKAPVTIDLSGWDTAKVTDMHYMFENVGQSATAPIHIYVGDGWQIGSETSTGYMFIGAKGLVGQSGTAWASGNPTNGTYARVDKAKENPSVPGYFWDHNYTPPNPPVDPENNTNNFTNINNTYNTTNNSTNTTGTTDQGNSTDSYSKPQGVSSTKNIIPGTSGPNWFLFILLLTLSILTLGVSLFLFHRKRKQQKNY